MNTIKLIIKVIFVLNICLLNCHLSFSLSPQSNTNKSISTYHLIDGSKATIIHLTYELLMKYSDQIIKIQNSTHPNSTKITKEALLNEELLGKQAKKFWQYSYIALVNGIVVGYNLNYKRKKDEFPSNTVSSDSIYINIQDVDLKFHNKGIGTFLLYHAIMNLHKDFSHNEMFYITIQTRKNNISMNRVINKFGFNLVGQKYYNPEKTDNIYELELTKNIAENIDSSSHIIGVST